jgi:dienelactone hydrolase
MASTVRTRAIDYEHGGTKLKGFLAHDGALKGRRPGVLVFPGWWGLDENARNRARRLAELGYVAFVADVYGGGGVIDLAHPEDAAGMAAALRANATARRGRARAALERLAELPNVDASKVAATGQCLDTALQLAYGGAALKAVVTFHSVLPVPTDAEVGAVRADVLVCVGEADPIVPLLAVAAFRVPLAAAGVGVDVVIYPGVGHGFTSPDADRVGNPDRRYDRVADEDSWRRMREFLAAAFGESKPSPACVRARDEPTGSSQLTNTYRRRP